ncbi:cytochrome d ubiquinol oxidase subunit II [Thalassobacillus devorans]|uniref:cytochrome d ubiquinol oxidase subunit II n=1 Tax=Thalassobacillus devorans TaxID=279813 RepID=UPI000A1CD4AF|nr:cytochrome d ubiquinol oxidase subunit II [Thalassobacillus devorans]
MEASIIAITILWSFLYIYSMLGSLDFGAGFWGMIYGKKNNTGASLIANRFLSPTWEVTNVFLVLFVVALYSFFPFAASMLGVLFLLPIGLGLVLLTIRTTFMVFSHSVKRYGRLLQVISGITGILIPALLVSILPVTLGGFITMENGHHELLYGKLLTSFTTYAHILFGICTQFFLSALFLADYASVSKDPSAAQLYRKHAIVAGPVTIVVAVLTLFTLEPEASWFLTNVENHLYGFGMSLLLFLFGYAALFLKNRDGQRGLFRYAVVFVVLQYGFAIYAYGSSHLPYMVYPHLTIEEAFTNPSMFYALLIATIIGMAILVPAFYLFWKLFLKDRRYLEQ